MPASVPGLLRRSEREQHVPIHPARLFRRRHGRRVEALDLGGDPHGEVARVERLDQADPGAAGDGRLPGRRGVEADRSDGSQPGDDDASHARRESVVGSGTWPSAPERPADLDPLVPFPPMEAELVRELPHGDGWAFEPKWDGFRGVLENAGGELRLWSRNGRPLLRYFPELAALGDLLPPGRRSTARS